VNIEKIGKKGTVTLRNVEITNWSETQIEITSVDAITGDIATVNSIYGTNSTEVTEQGVPKRKQKPKLNKKGG
jgi:hypothetical protein